MPPVLENVCRAFSPGSTDRPLVSEDAGALELGTKERLRLSERMTHLHIEESTYNIYLRASFYAYPRVNKKTSNKAYSFGTQIRPLADFSLIYIAR